MLFNAKNVSRNACIEVGTQARDLLQGQDLIVRAREVPGVVANVRDDVVLLLLLFVLEIIAGAWPGKVAASW